jgi:prephenate dehydrogenase
MSQARLRLEITADGNMAKIKLPPKLPFKKVGIAGLGLIGGSLAKALIPFGGLELFVFDHDPQTQAAARRVRRFAAVTGDLETFLGWPLDLAYLCLPVRRNLEVVEIMGRRQAPYPVTDCGSTKAPITRAANEAGLIFCGGHPISGREVSGYRHASADLIPGSLFIVTPPEKAAPEIMALAEKLRSLHELLGCRVRVMTPEAHDRLYGLVSHLPYLAAVSLAGAVLKIGGEETLPWAGTGFRDSTRVSASSPPKWAEIALENADNLVENIDALREILAGFRQALAERDERKLLDMLQPIAAFRQKL